MAVPILSNHRINKARLTHGKYLARYVEEQCLNLAIKPTVSLNLVAILSMCICEERFLSIKVLKYLT